MNEFLDRLKRAENRAEDRAREVEQQIEQELVSAEEGAGPLLQRDYWAVIRNAGLRPQGLAEMLATRFTEFPPPELVRFHRPDGADSPLQVGDRLDVDIELSGRTGVQVVHRDENSMTLGTVRGHPEAGRITFGAYPNERGDVVFHIRSRARSSSEARYVGFLAAGEAMQTNTWTDFIDRLANSVGDGVVGTIHADTREIEDEGEDAAHTPTFLAQGD